MPIADRQNFLLLSVVVEGGLVVLAVAIGWWVGVSPFAELRWTWPALVAGVGGAVPIFLMFLWAHQRPIGPFREIRSFLVDGLGPALSALRWYDLMLVAALAGIGEEALFRGTLQPWMERLGRLEGLLLVNLLFGLCHAVTPLYIVLASAIGFYLSWLLEVLGERNLLVPIVTHGLYDYLAFLVVVQTWRATKAEPQAEVPP